MKSQHWLLSVLFALGLSQSAAAIESSQEYYQSRFESLLNSGDAVVNHYYERALILQHEVNSFQAVFITVEDQNTHEICGFGAKFRDEYAIGTETYILGSQYYCDEQFEPYTGLFQLKNRKCSFSCPPTPAAGVGNLKMKPQDASRLISLPKFLYVVIKGSPEKGN